MQSSCEPGTRKLKKFFCPIFSAALISISFVTAYAGEHDHHHDHDHEENEEFHVEQHDAHEHGAATAQIVYTDSKLQIEIDTPAFNLLGFEHEPRNEEQHKKIENTRVALNDSVNVVRIEPHQVCALISRSISSPLFMEEEHAHKDEHGHAEEHEHVETHNDIKISYEFKCDQVPNTLSFLLFDAFSGLSEIDAQIVTEREQSAKTLTGKDPDISLK